MAKVLVTMKVMPADEISSIEIIEQEIRKKINPDRIEREPIAFGLVALKVSKLIEDASGELDNMESKIREITSVGGVEVVEITRTI